MTRPALAPKRPAGAIAGRELKIYIDLVDHLHNDVGSVAGGVVGILTLAWVSHVYDPAHHFLHIMMLVGALGFWRLGSIIYYRRKLLGRIRTYSEARRWEIIYAAGAIAYAFIVGIFGILVAADAKTEPLEALVIASVVGYAGGIAGRNAGRPHVAIGQVMAACAPIFAYSLWTGGGIHYGIAAMIFIYAATLAKIVYGLERITSKAFETQRVVGEVNERLDTAIAHMKSGLCMADATGGVQIINQRAWELLRLPDGDYRKMHEVLLGALASGSLLHADVAEIQSGIAERREVILKTVGQHNTVLTLKVALTPAGGAVLTLDDITEQTRAAADIERMAKYDSLTGLSNRPTVMAALAEAIADSAIEGEHGKVALLLIDLDKFKEVNDTLGHDVGDELLIKAAERLKSIAPPFATVGRLGGDEFVVVAPGLGQTQARMLAERINKALAKPLRLMGQLCSSTASIGIAVSRDHGADTAELVKAADIALYARKAAGRNGYDVFDSRMAEGLARRRRLEQDLAAALENGGLTIAFQPIVTADASHRVVAYEALARWTHPEFGPISPDEFVPIAESTGLVAELGRQVLFGACREAMRWPEDVQVSVNVSAIQMRNRGGLFDDIWSALAASGLPARRLDIEMTESILVEDASGVSDLIAALRSMDVSVSLDDFGTGYSSLAYVQNYRFDKIKLDKAFAASIESDHTTRATVAALASIAAATGSKLLLEGVETEAQARVALAQGVQQLQGYLFGRPQEAAVAPQKITGKAKQRRAA